MGFAVLFFATFALNSLLLGGWDIVPDHIAILFLPAFVRVAAVLVAGLAGILGIVLGSFVVAVVLGGESIGYAALLSVASGSGIWVAYWLMCKSLNVHELPFTLVTLVTLTVIYSALNAMAHGLLWDFFPPLASVTLDQLTLMMVGDLLGVMVGFVLVRSVMRLLSIGPSAN